MPRTSNEAEVIAAYATQTAPPSPPSNLTEEQRRYWIAIVADLPAGYIRSDTTPCLIELVRAMSYATQVSETLTAMRNAELGGEDETQRETFAELLQMSREQSRVISLLSTKLRFTVQARDTSRAAARADPLGRAATLGFGRRRPGQLGRDVLRPCSADAKPSQMAQRPRNPASAEMCD
jgi:hypothetical protein